MKPEPSAKANASPVKMILWIVLGAAVVIWFILQRNTSQTPSAGPAARSNSSLSNDMSAGTSSYPAPPPPQAAQQQNERVERYPMLDAPDEVALEQEFLIQVSLTEQQLTPDVQILNGEKPANTVAITVDTVPGTLWRYSGGGYVALQLLLSDVTQKPVPQLLEELVLRPIGMTHSTFEEPLPGGLWPSAATPYRPDGTPVKGGWHNYPEITPAGLWSTPSDLALMAIEVQNEYAGKSSKILSSEMVHEMLKHQKDDWGLGFALEAPGHKLRFSHGGSNEGFRCTWQAYTEAPGQGTVLQPAPPTQGPRR